MYDPRLVNLGDAFVEPLFAHGPAFEASGVVATKNENAAEDAVFVQYGLGRRAQWDIVRAFVFGACARQGNVIVMNFIPAQTADLGGALAGQQQQFYDGAVVVVVAGAPNGAQLCFAQDAFTRLLFVSLGVGRDVAIRQADALLDRPAQKRGERGA